MTDKLQIKRRFFFEILIWMIWTQTILMQYVRAAVMRMPVMGSYPDAVMTTLSSYMFLWLLQFALYCLLRLL